MEQLRSILKDGVVFGLCAAAACTSPPLDQAQQDPSPSVEVPNTASPMGGSGVVSDPPEVFCNPSEVAGARPLSQGQYARTIKAVFGESIAKFSKPFPPGGSRGFDTDTSILNGGLATVEAAAENASAIAKQLITLGGSGLLPCDVTTAQNASDCAAKTMESLGPLVFRRPIEDPDRITLLALFERTRTKDGAVAGIESLVRSMLLSPSFLFQLERGQVAAAGTKSRFLAPHELAHRLAFVLWGTPADAALLDKAKAGELNTSAAIRTQVELMLKDPRSHIGIQDFYAQWLEFDDVATRPKDPKSFPRWNADVAAEALSESIQFVDNNFFVEDGKLEHLFTNRSAVVGPKLAEIYGVRGGNGKLELPITGRSGILTRVAFLAGGSGSWSTHPSFRGATMINSLLCENLPLPPANVEAKLADPSTAPRTTRQVVEMNVAQQTCATCHRLIDPIGFAFENYDATGIYRKTENGLPIDASGKVDRAIDGQDLQGSWNNAIEFSAWLSTQDKLKNCVAAQFWRYAASHTADGNKDSCAVERLSKVLARNGAGIRDLVIETLADEDFRKVAAGVEPKAKEPPPRGLPEGKTALETTLLIAARGFEEAGVGMPSESENQLKRWSQAFMDLAKRAAASSP